jgi:hypothetical protein
MSRDDDRLVRHVELTIYWCDHGRACKGGARLKRLARCLLGEAKSEIQAHGHVTDDAREKLLTALGALAEYLEMIR